MTRSTVASFTGGVAIFYLLCCHSVVHADPRIDLRSGKDVFIEACRRQGFSSQVIQSGYAEFELTVTSPVKTAKEVQEEIDKRVVPLKEMMERESNPAMKASMKTAIAEIPKLLHAKSGSAKRSRVKLLFRSTRSPGPRQYEVSNFDPVSGDWEKPVIAICRNATTSRSECALWDQAASTAVISSTVFSAADFFTFGRIQGQPVDFATALFRRGTDPTTFEFSPDIIADFKKELANVEAISGEEQFKIVDKATYDQDAIALVIESRGKGNPRSILTQRYLIDPSRDYICPLIELFDGRGRVIQQWRSSDYFLNEASGLWFPSKHVFSKFDPNKPDQVIESQSFEIDAESLKLNQTVSDEEFAITIPSGASIIDSRTKQTTYNCREPVTLSFGEAGMDLGAKSGLIASVPAASPKLTTEHRNPYRLRLILLANLVAVFAAGLIFWRRRSKSVASLFFLVLAFESTGCAKTNMSGPVESKLIEARPAVIEFGRVNEAVGTVATEFRLFNHSKQPITVSEISTSCGCTSATVATSTIQAGASLLIPVTIRVNRRLGNFEGNVAVKTSGTEGELTIPIHGNIVNDVWYNGQPVACAIDAKSSIATGTVEVFTANRPNVAFDSNDIADATSLKELSRQRRNDVTAIRLAFSIPIGENAASRSKTYNIKLSPTDKSIAAIGIPVTCYRADGPQPTGETEQAYQKIPRISLGRLARGEIRMIDIAGPSGDQGTLSSFLMENIPDGLSISFNEPTGSSPKQTVKIQVSPAAELGYFHGRIRAHSPSGTDHAFIFLGMIDTN